MTIRKRPWDKPLDYEIRVNKKEDCTAAPKTKTKTKIPIPQFNVVSCSPVEEETPTISMDTNIPHVTIDGIPFYSDRFYLNVPEESVVAAHPIPPGSSSTTIQPPLFDRRRLIQSLDLQAVILATYTWDAKTLSNLLIPDNKTQSIPCLVLHGSEIPTRRTTSTWVVQQDTRGKRYKDNALPQLYQQPVFSCPACDTDEEQEEEVGDKEKGEKKTSALDSLLNQHWKLYFTRILSTWIPPLQNSSSTNTITNTRQFCKGVHHPKFMLLFETNGSMIVVVSTANLTPASSIDASWIQRFPPKQQLQEEEEDTWDFGPILFDFLEKQSLAAKEGDMLPLDFLQKYYKTRPFKSWRGLQKCFDFSQAQVQLVSTVPGTYSNGVGGDDDGMFLEHGTGKKKKQRKRVIRYGPQRIAEILARVQEKKKKEDYPGAVQSNEKKGRTNPWLPTHLLSRQDRLIIQSTSWGASPWSGYHMVQLARMYLGWDSPTAERTHSTTLKDKNMPGTPMYDSQDLLEQVDILWPTQECMTHIRSVHNNTGAFDGADPQLGFFTSQAFNETDLACISRMAQYVPNHTHFFPYVLPPHLKTIGRILKRRSTALSKVDATYEQDVDNFAWILLTSACLSRGAQGFSKTSFISEKKDDIENTMSFTNFELGVFFCSRIEGNPTTDRLYQSIPKSMDTGDLKSSGKQSSSPRKSTARIIPIPIPYKCRPSMYQPQSSQKGEDSSDAYFVARPYFHWILDGTLGIGNMKLIPESCD